MKPICKLLLYMMLVPCFVGVMRPAVALSETVAEMRDEDLIVLLQENVYRHRWEAINEFSKRKDSAETFIPEILGVIKVDPWIAIEAVNAFAALVDPRSEVHRQMILDEVEETSSSGTLLVNILALSVDKDNKALRDNVSQGLRSLKDNSIKTVLNALDGLPALQEEMILELLRDEKRSIVCRGLVALQDSNHFYPDMIPEVLELLNKQSHVDENIGFYPVKIFIDHYGKAGKLGQYSPRVLELVKSKLEGRNEIDKFHALTIAAMVGESARDLIPNLLECLSDADSSVVQEAAYALAGLTSGQDEELLPKLHQAMKGQRKPTQAALLYAISKIDGKWEDHGREIIGFWKNYRDHEDLTYPLKRMGKHLGPLVPSLIDLFEKENYLDVEAEIVEIIGAVENERSLDFLRTCLDSPDFKIRLSALTCILAQNIEDEEKLKISTKFLDQDYQLQRIVIPVMKRLDHTSSIAITKLEKLLEAPPVQMYYTEYHDHMVSLQAIRALPIKE